LRTEWDGTWSKAIKVQLVEKLWARALPRLRRLLGGNP
jgi:hypothetical protein